MNKICTYQPLKDSDGLTKGKNKVGKMEVLLKQEHFHKDWPLKRDWMRINKFQKLKNKRFNADNKNYFKIHRLLLILECCNIRKWFTKRFFCKAVKILFLQDCRRVSIWCFSFRTSRKQKIISTFSYDLWLSCLNHFLLHLPLL